MTRRIIPHAPATSLSAVVLAVGEIVYDETIKCMRIGDGATPGGTTVDPAMRSSSVDLGALPAGSTNVMDWSRTVASADPSGTTQAYNLVSRFYAEGSQPYDFVRGCYFGTHLNTSGGVSNQVDGSHTYIWLGGAGSVVNAVGVACHIRADGPGDITNEATWFRANDASLIGGSTIKDAKGFSVGQIGGDGTNVENAYCFDAEDNFATGINIGFRSQLSAGTNKYAFFGGGTAASSFGGKVSVGQTIAPLWALSVKSADGNYAVDVNNSHATSPYGMRIRYTGGSPNDNDHAIFNGSTTTGDKINIWSTGSIVNATNSYGAISDVKLKKEIRDAGPQLADIRAVKLRKYKLIADGEDAKDHLGVIAQELEEVSPGLVTESADKETYFEQAYEMGGVGEPDRIPIIGQGEWKERSTGTVTKSVNYSILYLKAIKALQELADDFDALKAQIAANA